MASSQSISSSPRSCRLSNGIEDGKAMFDFEVKYMSDVAGSNIGCCRAIFDVEE